MGCGICIKWLALPSSYANRHWHFLHTVHPSWPLCSGPENHRTLATIKSPNRIIHSETLPYWNYSPPYGAAVTAYLWKDCVVISKDLTVRYSLYEKDNSIHLLPIYHPCLLFSSPPFIYPSIHLSIHQFILPLFHMWLDLSWPPRCLCSYTDITTNPVHFSNWLKRHNSVQVTGSRNLRVQKNFLRRLQFGPLQWLKPSGKQFMLMNKLYWGASVGIRGTFYPSDCVWYCFSIIMRSQTMAGKRKGRTMVEKNGAVFFWFRESTPTPAIPTPFFLILLPAQSFSLVKLWTH